MSNTHSVSFGGTGIPQTVLPSEDASVLADLAAMESLSEEEQLAAAAKVAAANPRSLASWAALGARGRDTMESYAYYRIGYHRGLDALRQNGWRGSGYVRWEHETNRPFLRCLAGLRACAEQIGETDEVERIELFLKQLEPSWNELAESVLGP